MGVMDETTLAYHTKLHQWYELHRLNRSGDMASLKLPEDGAHLSPQKVVEIDLWRKEVNKVFIKPKKPEKRPEFWRCHMSAPTSAKNYSFSADPRRVKSARFFSSRKTKQSSVDINALPSHLAELSIHYNQERRKVHNSRFSAEDLLVKGKRQDLHLPQFMQMMKNTSLDDDTRSNKADAQTNTQKTDKDCDVTTQTGSGLSSGTTQPEAAVNTKTVLGDRSVSNNLLNVMSIDDCRMGVRYRPNRVVSTHELQIQNESSNSGESKTESKDPPYPLHLSQGSGVTPLSHGKLNSVLSAQWIKHKQYVVQGDNTLPERPQSAVLDRAFQTILREKSKQCNPIHPKEVRFFACSPDSPPPNQGKHIYQRLNSTLKNKMANMRNAHWDNIHHKDVDSGGVQYSRNGGGSNRFSRRSTATNTCVWEDAKQL